MRPFIKEQKDTVLRDLKCIKAVNYIYKCCFYTFATVWAYKVMLNSHYFPTLLGGNCKSFPEAFKGYPYIDRSSYPELKTYYLFTFGYHFSTVLTLIYTPKRREFFEMGLHHMMVVYLYFGGYFINVLEPASVFIMMHDIADIPLSFTKIFADSNYKHISIISFMFTMIVWFWTRNFVMPIVIYETMFYLPNLWHPSVVPLFSFFMSCLCALHFYW